MSTGPEACNGMLSSSGLVSGSHFPASASCSVWMLNVHRSSTSFVLWLVMTRTNLWSSPCWSHSAVSRVNLSLLTPNKNSIIQHLAYLTSAAGLRSCIAQGHDQLISSRSTHTSCAARRTLEDRCLSDRVYCGPGGLSARLKAWNWQAVQAGISNELTC